MSIKWDVLKNRIKECSIKFGVKKAKLMRNEINELENEMNSLDNKTHLTENERIRKQELQNQLFKIYENKSEGARIRARIDNIDEVESNEKLFKSIESSRQSNNIIEKLSTPDGREIQDPSEILCEMGNFYSKLYTSKANSIKDIDKYLKEIRIEHILNDNDRESLEKMPTLDEIDKVLLIIKENKSPGTDGLPIEFYKTFKDIIMKHYLNMITEAWGNQILPFSTRTSVISTIHKQNEKNLLIN